MPRNGKKKSQQRAATRSAHAGKTVAIVVDKAQPKQIKGSGAYSVGQVIQAAKDVASYTPTSLVGKATKAAVTAGAASLGIPFAGSLGSAASWLTKFFGAGRYGSVPENITNSYAQRPETSYASGFPTNSMATFAGRGGPTYRLRHSEFITDVDSSISFIKKAFALNPGNPLLMPWGSQVARLYEMFRWRGIVFEYRPTSATAISTATGAMGSVLMATDYDCYDAGYDDKRAMEASMFAVQCLPYERAFHPIECAKSMNGVTNQYVVPGLINPTDAAGDERLSILGNFYFATQGQQASQTSIGELWVHYDVEFSRPILEDNNTGFTQHVLFTTNSTTFSQTTIVNSHPNTGMNFKQGVTYDRLEINKGNRVLSGTYLFVIRGVVPIGGTNSFSSLNSFLFQGFNGATLTPIAYTNTGSPNTANVCDYGGYGSTAYATSNVSMSAMVVNLPTNEATFQVQLGVNSATGGGNAYYDVYITQYNMLWNAKLEKRLTNAVSLKNEVVSVSNDLIDLRAEIAKLRQAVKDSKDEATDDGGGTAAPRTNESSWGQVAPIVAPTSSPTVDKVLELGNQARMRAYVTEQALKSAAALAYK